METENSANATILRRKEKVRIAWKIIKTGYEGRGEWHNLSREEFIKQFMNASQKIDTGIAYQLEYE